MRTRLLISVALVALVATSCGSRATTTDGADTTIGSTVAPSTGSEPGMFGTIASPCGPGDASGATDIGVTDDAITYTSVSDSGGKIGGLNKGVDDSQAAFVKWCNDQGGINGRKIELEMRDAALFDYGNVVTAACADSLAIVGGVSAFDDVGAPIQVSCGLPNVPAGTASSAQSGADLTYAPLPNPPNKLMVGAATWVSEHNPTAITKAGFIHTDVSAIDYLTARQIEAYELIGYDFVYDAASAIGEVNWPSMVSAMQQDDVQFLTGISTWEEFINLQSAMVQQNMHPEVTQFDANMYQEQYPQKSGGNAEGTLLQVTIWPFEEADHSPAMATYLASLEAAVPGAKPEMLGALSFSAGLLWATAVKTLGSDVTRAGLAEALSNIHSWDGGGLHGESDPGANEPSPCFILMGVEGDGFTRVFPTDADDPEEYKTGKGFACNDDYVVNLTTDFETDQGKLPK